MSTSNGPVYRNNIPYWNKPDGHAVKFATDNLINVREHPYNAVPGADCTAAFTAAWNDANALWRSIYIPGDPSAYIVTAALPVITTAGISIFGDGIERSKIQFDPPVGGTTVCIQFGDGSVPAGRNPMYRGKVDDIQIISSATTATRVALKVIDVSEFEIGSFLVSFQYAAAGNNSIGFWYKGRDAMRVGKLTIFADRPMLFDKNPNNATNDMDHAHFGDVYLNGLSKASGGKLIECVDGWNPTNVCFDGFLALVGGDYGIYWDDTSSLASAIVFKISAGRYEQGTLDAGYAIYVNKHGAAQGGTGWSISNFFCGGSWRPAQGGTFLRGINATIRNCGYGGSGTPLSVDDSCTMVVTENCSWGSTTVSKGSMVVHSSNPFNGNVNAPPCAVYELSTNAAPQHREYDVPGWRWKGTLTVGATKALPFGGNNKVALVRVAASDSATHAGYAEGLLAMVAGGNGFGGGSAKLIANTTNCAASDSANKLCIVYDGIAPTIKNNLASTADVVVEVVWNTT